MEFDTILIAYGELTLKSCKVRKRFTNILIHNIKQALKDSGAQFEVSYDLSRAYVKTKEIKKAIDVLKRVFGISWFAPSLHLKLSELEDFVKKNWRKFVDESKTFAVRVKRVGKHDFTSMELASKLGSYIDAKVDLTNPRQTVYVEVRQDDCYLFTQKIKGAGGLPVGSSGRVVVLFSDGIDSPVATWFMLKRGCEVSVLIGRMLKDRKYANKIKKLLKLLSKWSAGRKIRVFMYDHFKCMEKVSKVAKSNTCIICKRMMYRMADIVARIVRAKAIVTGENLAQVASQTLENIYTIDEASEFPVIRPLIGFDKNEIVELARSIGSYEISTSMTFRCPYKPKRVVTHSNVSLVKTIEEKIGIEELIKTCSRTLREVEI